MIVKYHYKIRHIATGKFIGHQLNVQAIIREPRLMPRYMELPNYKSSSKVWKRKPYYTNKEYNQIGFEVVKYRVTYEEIPYDAT